MGTLYIITLFQKERYMSVKVNRHRWFFTKSKYNGALASRELEVIDYNDGNRRKTLYLSNDGGSTFNPRPDTSGSNALPEEAIIKEWYPKSLIELQTRLNIRVTDESIANLRTPLAVNDWKMRDTRNLYPNFPVDPTLIKEPSSGDNRVEVESY
jgi:hypothetical protein